MTYTGKLIFEGADTESAIYAMPYSFSALESSAEGITHYLNVQIYIDGQSYTFIKKVVENIE